MLFFPKESLYRIAQLGKERLPITRLTAAASGAFWRIMAEIRSICVYCGSGTGNHPVFVETADRLGRLMAKAGIR
ncbi:MAG: hypothetical protein KDJ16_15640, partial [Hyphomicrobiales bacterium]|nr:hypothetical protein [Hyphomicrobiales bacterium]